MSAPPFTEVVPGVHAATRVDGAGWEVNMYALTLPSGGLLVHSPTRADGAPHPGLDALGRPEVLLAPNHFHHMGLPAYRARYPGAVAVTSDGARPRLTRQGHADLAPLDAARERLPRGARLLECRGVKTGEVFLSLEAGGERVWIVCDALFHVTRPLTGVLGAALRTLKTSPGLCVGQTFLWLALRDRRAYLGWLREQLAAERPATILFSHGAPYEVGDGAELDRLLERRLS
ncbi:MAG: hypothetical protein IT374_21925 [Polyangiaceae bacterium]|nr:hypothetical protein [Polyangiaceae bacterium]